MVRIDDQKIYNELDEIRKKIGADKAPYVPRAPYKSVKKDLNSFEELEDLVDLDMFFDKETRQPMFVYIRDHTVGQFFDKPEKRHKIHFIFCQTLRDMKRREKIHSRYRQTNRDDNRYFIDVKQVPKEREVSLYPCQNCLSESGYLCFDYAMESSDKKEIVEKFDAKEVLDFLWQRVDIFRREMEEQGVESAAKPAGRPRGWFHISKRIRNLKKFTCEGEGCGVKLNKHPGCLDVHHKDQDTRNNRDDNLICLCKICHAKEHPHYSSLIGDCREKIESARRQQGLI